MRVSMLRLVAVLALSAAAAGCGKATSARSSLTGGGSSSGAAAAGGGGPSGGVVGVATKNTTRLGGADPATDAAAVALAVYPGLTTATRPQAVTIVNEHNWPASLAAATLASVPLGAPVLYADGSSLPVVTVQALRELRPLGAAAVGGAQVIEVGTTAVLPSGYRTTRVQLGPGDPASAAAAIARFAGSLHGRASGNAIVLAADGSPALQMPAAGLSAESGAPILFVTRAGVPAATAAALARLHRPAIYVIDPASVSSTALTALARLGHVTRIPDEAGAVGAAGEKGGVSAAGTAKSGVSTAVPPESGRAVENAIAVSRFTSGTFGWGVKEPGHGLVFANSTRPLDAPASALLAASGDYGPLLLLERPAPVPFALASYLSDIKPAYGRTAQFAPIHGAYNRGWLIGDKQAISALTQAELDSMLEIAPAPRTSSGEEEASEPSSE